ncbi:DUF1415 domain-containing protein [Pacificibacter marinus]|uniref:DUF1415 domain-containing protein n=1 Tax=Pacificibacter marinus TaxID=658057 RepID=A0A1Y5RTX5_9RHOB|nr:DUF1415 domain-containing protein [Pacificibacter marinus]SEK40036.1 hypothetical protein SAMN04488032_102198 [Pacificibacter marinus]SLN25365.1 hypothetical protein PAM7971_00888 [Pacificibacter marinus]
MGRICFKLVKQERIYRINKFDPKTLSIAHQDVVKSTRRWLDQMVVGLNLCPFASSVIARDQVYYAVCDTTTETHLKQFCVDELQRLLGANEIDISTSLLMFTHGLEDFGDYLDLLDWFQHLLENAELTEHVQLASFHPHYQFDGVAADDLSHFTNRSPYPTIHILRQDQMTKVLAHVSDPEKIYVDNIKTLNKLGRRQIEALCPWGIPRAVEQDLFEELQETARDS